MFGTSYEKEFSKNLLISSGVHLLLIGLMFVGGHVVNKVFKSGDIEIIRASVRVDVVGMPKFTIQELKEMQQDAIQTLEPEMPKGGEEIIEKSPEETSDVIKENDIVIKEEGKSKKSFLNLISNYSSKKIEKREQQKGVKAGAGNKNINSLILEGNRLSKGSALVGDFSEETSSEFAAYAQILPENIRQFWKLPTYLLDKNHRCRIKIYLTSAGQLLKLEMQESSGNDEFDARAEKAIRDAAPFPKTSEAVGARLSSTGIILGFPL